MGSSEVGYFPSQKKEEQSYSEIISNVCPDYLAMGMTLEEFWHGDSDYFEYVRKAHKLRCQHENYNAWLQGVYIYNALQCVAPMYRDLVKDHRADKYFTEPIEIYPKETTAAEKERAEDVKELENQATIRAWVDRANRLYSEKHKEGAENGK